MQHMQLGGASLSSGFRIGPSSEFGPQSRNLNIGASRSPLLRPEANRFSPATRKPNEPGFAGMPLSEAFSLTVGKGAGGKAVATIEPHNAHADRLALCELAAWCEKFSPLVGIEEAASPDSLLLDVTGLAHIFGSEEELARLAARKLAERQYAPRLAIAGTVGTAWAVSHYHFADEPTIVPRGETKFLLDLPIEGLRLPAASVEVLHQLGVNFIAEVVRLSRASLKARFGPELLLRWIN